MIANAQPHQWDRRAALLGALAAAAMPAAAQARFRPASRFPVTLHDLTVTDARSRTRFNLMRDLVQGRVVLINFMFTGCSTVCPMQAAIMARAQRLLADDMAKNLIFASISITPLIDTPEALVEFADAHGAGKGWHFLRGGIRETDAMREGFDSYAPVVDNHPPVFCIGRADAPAWTRLYGAPRPELVAAEIRHWLGAS